MWRRRCLVQEIAPILVLVVVVQRGKRTDAGRGRRNRRRELRPSPPPRRRRRAPSFAARLLRRVRQRVRPGGRFDLFLPFLLPLDFLFRLWRRRLRWRGGAVAAFPVSDLAVVRRPCRLPRIAGGRRRTATAAAAAAPSSFRRHVFRLLTLVDCPTIQRRRPLARSGGNCQPRRAPRRKLRSLRRPTVLKKQKSLLQAPAAARGQQTKLLPRNPTITILARQLLLLLLLDGLIFRSA